MVHNTEPEGTDTDTAGTRLPTPEELAGHELRRLRTVRGWSQEEVARRMAEYGYDWHQTTVGRTEAATRPLRLNEAVSLAALFGIPVTQMLAPIMVDVPELDGEIQELRERWAEAVAAGEGAESDAHRATVAAHEAQMHRATANAEVHRLSGRIEYLLSVRAILDGKPVDPEVAAQIIAQQSRERETRR